MTVSNYQLLKTELSIIDRMISRIVNIVSTSSLSMIGFWMELDLHGFIFYFYRILILVFCCIFEFRIYYEPAPVSEKISHIPLSMMYHVGFFFH